MDKKQISRRGISLALNRLSEMGYVFAQKEGVRLAMTNAKGKRFQVEVRTTGKTPSRSRMFGLNYEWFISREHETSKAKNLVYLFVLLAEVEESARLFLVPGEVVAEYATREHKYWLAQPHNKDVKSTDIRKFRISLDATSHGLNAATYENNWEVLDW